MEAGMADQLLIENVHIKNFGCVQDLEMNLTPLHALIGPNDSGKSTILRAVRTGMQLINGNFSGSLDENSSQCLPFHPGWNENSEINIVAKDYFRYSVLFLNSENLKESVTLRSGLSNDSERKIWYQPEGIKPFLGIFPKLTKTDLQSAHLSEFFGPKSADWKSASMRNKFDALIKQMKSQFPYVELTDQKPRMVRIDPDSLREPGDLIPSSNPIDFEENGAGIASVLDALMIKHYDGFLFVREKMRQMFPTIDSISMKNIEVTDEDLFTRGPHGDPTIPAKKIKKALEISLKNGAKIPAAFMSEGMLYYLAFATLQYLKPASILLVEEPENGLHPSRIKEIMKVLRDLSNSTQVLIATHSPLVINEMQPKEVSIIRRDPDKGTWAEPMKKTKNFEERAKTYALGELWLSYADGEDERELRGDDSK
jgi:predicted ATPase